MLSLMSVVRFVSIWLRSIPIAGMHQESRASGGASTRRAGNIGNTPIQLGKTAMSSDTSDAVLTLVININGDDTLRTTAERWLDHDGGQCWGKASSV